MLKSLKRSEAFFCGYRTLTKILSFTVEFLRLRIRDQGSREAFGRWLVLRGACKVNYKSNFRILCCKTFKDL